MPSEIRFLLKHSSVYGLGNILSQAVSFVLLPLYTAYLTPEDYGVLELITLTTGLIAITLGVGISGGMSRFYYESAAESERRKVISTSLLLVLAAAAGSLVVLEPLAGVFARRILDSAAYERHFTLGFVTLASGLVFDTGLVYLRLQHRSVTFMWVTLTRLTVQIALNLFFVVHLRAGVLGVLSSSAIVNACGAALLAASVLWQVGVRVRWPLAKAMLRYSTPLIPSSLASLAVAGSDRYFIKHFGSIADAGIYALASKIGWAIHMLVTSPFIMVFLARRFEIVQRPDAKETFRKVSDCHFLALVLLGLPVAVFAEDLVAAMTAPSFHRAASLIPIVVVASVVSGMKYHFETGLLYRNKTALYGYITTGVAGVQLALNVWLVSRHGVFGAAYASLVAAALNGGLIYAFSYRVYPVDFGLARKAVVLSCGLVGIFLGSHGLSGLAGAPYLASKVGVLVVSALGVLWLSGVRGMVGQASLAASAAGR